MRSLLDITFKSAVIVIALLFVISILAIFAEEVPDYEAHEAALDTWLNGMKIEEDKDLTAETLREICDSKAVGYDGFCTGYLLGFVEGYGAAPSIKFCDNGSLRSATQAEQIFLNYMNAHPQHWRIPRSPILGAALQEAFPCSNAEGL